MSLSQAYAKPQTKELDFVVAIVTFVLFGGMWVLGWMERNNDYFRTARVVGTDSRICTYTNRWKMFSEGLEWKRNPLKLPGMRFIDCSDQAEAERLRLEGWKKHDKNTILLISFTNAIGQTIEHRHVLPREEAQALRAGDPVSIWVGENSTGGIRTYRIRPDGSILQRMPLIHHIATGVSVLFLLHACRRRLRRRTSKNGMLHTEQT